MRLYLLILFMLISLIGLGQVSNLPGLRIGDAVTAFGKNVPAGSLIADLTNKKVFLLPSSVASASTLGGLSEGTTKIELGLASRIFYDYDGTLSGNRTITMDGKNLTFASATSAELITFDTRISQTGLGNSTFFGYQAGNSDDLTSNSNTAFGYQALSGVSTTTQNVAVGYGSLGGTYAGGYSIGMGYNAGLNSSSSYAVYLGRQAGANNTGGNAIAIGANSLDAGNSGDSNIAIGYGALTANTTGQNNTAIGANSLDSNTEGLRNIGIGTGSLGANTTGSYNIGIGESSLAASNASYNTAIGRLSGYSNTSGGGNTFIGYAAGDNNTTGGSNIIIGYNIDAPSATGSNQLNIGNLIKGDMSGGTVTFNSAYTFPAADGNDGQVLTTDGAGTVAWEAPAGGGNVSNTGTPADNQVAVWTDATTIEGTSGLTYNGTALDITGNITLSGTVDGIDIATDVAANTSARHTQNTDSIYVHPSTFAADHTYSGDVITWRNSASTTASFGEVHYLPSGGRLEKADADASTTVPAYFMALESIGLNTDGLFLKRGHVRDDSWNWTVGGMIYLSSTAGALTQTAPTGTGKVVQILGIAMSADSMFFDPQLVYVILK